MASATPPPPRRRQPETIWRLVSAKCDQISEAISAARLPFVLALTLSVVWLSALYVSRFSYVGHLREELVGAAAMGSVDVGTTLRNEAEPLSPMFKDLCQAAFKRIPPPLGADGKPMAFDAGWQVRHCRNRIHQQYEFLSRMDLESTIVSWPWGMGRMHISDFGISANAALVLILAWLLFALRRENHAVKNFVDFHDAYRPGTFSFRDPFIITATEPVLSAEHYAYAYHAVSQRFMFQFSTHRSPLFLASLFMGSIPAIASILNFASNIVSLAQHSFSAAVYIRFAVEAGLVVLVLVITVAMIRYMLNTSVLLNGWGLAVSKVWLKDWDERMPDDAASMVLVSISGQTAQRTSDPFGAAGPR